MKDEALKLALEALENQRIFTLRPDHEGKELTPKQVLDAIATIKQALAAPDPQAELDATNRQVEILSDALAESRREVAAKDTALDLALEALRSAAAELYKASSYCNTYEVLGNTNDAITAIQQALVRADEREIAIEDFKHRLAAAIDAMPFGDTAASFAVYIRDFK
jgi:tetratricopeptide (TPR) repeat protein